MKESSCNSCKHLVWLHDENRYECELYGGGFCGNGEAKSRWEST